MLINIFFHKNKFKTFLYSSGLTIKEVGSYLHSAYNARFAHVNR